MKCKSKDSKTIKNMQKILLILILILSETMAFSQMPTDGNYSNWDWENQSQSNWRSKYDNTWIDINPPFAASTERLGLMVQIHESGDYTKAKGWKLLWAQFDGDYPYFILYHPHKAIVRVFFYLERIPFTDVLATLSFYDITNPGILSFGDEYQTSTEDYYNNTTNSDNDMLSVIIRNVGVKNWGAADFPILYDNNIATSKFQNKKWKFQFYGCNNYSIHLKGTSSTDPAQLEQHTISASKTSIVNNTFNAQYTKLHKELQSTDKFLQEMQNSVKNINDDSPDFLKSYKNTVQGIKVISDVFSATVGVSAAVGAVISFVRIISGTFGESESTKPAAITQYIELEGTMTINQALGGTTLSIPGVSGTYYPPNMSWRPFNCPMGTINLQKTPKIKVTSAYEKYGYYESDLSYGWQDGKMIMVCGINGYPCLLTSGSHPLVTTYSAKYPGKFKKYKFDDDIVLARQELDGLQLIDVNFAIICKANGTGDRKYKVYDKYLAYHKFWGFYDSKEYHLPVENPVYKALIEGRFIIHKFDEVNNEVYFGTPYMDKNSLKGIVFEVPEDTDVKLALLAKYTSDKYSTPIIFKAVYNLSPVPETAQMSQVFCSQEQKSFPFSDFYNSPLYLSLNSANNKLNTACVIEMKSGFVGNNGFIAEALPLTKGLQNGNTVINVIDFNCGTSLLKSTSFANEITDVEILQDNSGKNIRPVLFPNPTNGILTIESGADNPLETISVFNTNGQSVINITKLGVRSKDIDMSGLPAGMYLINIRTGSKTYSERVILNK